MPLGCGVVVLVVVLAFDDVVLVVEGAEPPLFGEEAQLELAAPSAAFAVERAASTRCCPDATSPRAAANAGEEALLEEPDDRVDVCAGAVVDVVRAAFVDDPPFDGVEL